METRVLTEIEDINNLIEKRNEIKEKYNVLLLKGIASRVGKLAEKAGLKGLLISTFKKKPYKDAWFYSFKDSYFVGINTKGEFCAVTAETSDAGDKSLNIWEERTVTLSDEVLTIMPNYITQALIKMEISVNTEINNMSSLLEEAENAGIIIMK